MRPIFALSLGSLLLALGAVPALAAESAPIKESQGVGVYLSNIAGSGVTYHQIMSSGYGYHVSAVGWGDGTKTFVNAGAALTKVLDRRDWGHLYGLLGAGIGYDTFFGGAGLQGGSALQANITPGLGFSWGPAFLEIGYSFYRNSNTPIGFGPAGGLGLMWWF